MKKTFTPPDITPDHCLHLTSLKRMKGKGIECRKEREFRRRKVRIWSAEHCAWWRPDRAGYTTVEEMAGIYVYEDARASTWHCGPEKKIVYVIVPRVR